mmetsp:Transcript_1379/g.3991  ORF Transcript_1379/g.3991 Transcript_1379/m.3991 type:complete len:266 (+) Transcript_1379:1596-2393(+)
MVHHLDPERLSAEDRGFAYVATLFGIVVHEHDRYLEVRLVRSGQLAAHVDADGGGLPRAHVYGQIPSRQQAQARSVLYGRWRLHAERNGRLLAEQHHGDAPRVLAAPRHRCPLPALLQVHAHVPAVVDDGQFGVRPAIHPHRAAHAQAPVVHEFTDDGERLVDLDLSLLFHTQNPLSGRPLHAHEGEEGLRPAKGGLDGVLIVQAQLLWEAWQALAVALDDVHWSRRLQGGPVPTGSSRDHTELRGPLGVRVHNAHIAVDLAVKH